MSFSYWEIKNWFSDVDFAIAGSGIVGLQAALRLREKYPSSKILIVEKGMLPQGASTKNAGFACFGSLSEIVDDLQNHSEQEVVDLIRKRWNGLSILRNQLGDATIGFENFGGYEIFETSDKKYDNYLGKIGQVNQLLNPLFGSDVFQIKNQDFGFKNVRQQLVYNPFEAQIDTGNMMQALLKLAISNGIMILNRQSVKAYDSASDHVNVHLDDISFKSRHLLFATNGFAGNITGNAVRPARAQVLITKPIEGLRLKGTFHMDRGYYYFRNVGNRVLLGGARNLDFKGETTTEFGQSEIIINRLETLLKEVILPETGFETDHRWSGIMGMGDKKSPIVKQIADRVYCGVRLGGMGVAIGSLVGKELADLVEL